MLKVYGRTVAVFCAVTSDGLAPATETETRPRRTWSIEQCPLRTGGNTAAAVLVLVVVVVEENHQ